MKFSERLRRAVRGCGLTRYQVSKETGIPQSTLSRFVVGKAGLNLTAVDTLVEFLGSDVVEGRRSTRKE